MAVNCNVRELALEVLAAVEKEHFKFNDTLHTQLMKYQYLKKQDRAFLTRLCEGVMEYKLRLDYVIDKISNTPIHKCKPLIRCILRMGAYQILFMDSVPDSAACNEAVKLAKKRGFSGLSGFVNGVLRNLAKEKESISYPDRQKYPEKYLSIYYSIPEWIIGQWVSQYGLENAEIMAMDTVSRRPLTVRINQCITDIKSLSSEWEKEGIVSRRLPLNEAAKKALGDKVFDELMDTAFYLEGIDYLNIYDSFLKGMYTVQDAGAMISGIIFKQVAGYDKEDILALDMCAAPGGKTAFAAEILGKRGRVIARDVAKAKVDKLKETVERLNLTNVVCEVRDALDASDELFGNVDVVLLDAPCSGLGVLGRKKDICYEINEQQIEQLILLQRDMLKISLEYVKTGGYLIYSTCTVNKRENCDNIDWILNEHREFQKYYEAQLLPGVMPMDGSYIACLRKERSK